MSITGDTTTDFTLLGALILLASFTAKVAALGVIPGNRRPSSGMAWLLVVLLAPLLGIVFFFFFGSTAVGRKRHARQQAVNDRIAEATKSMPEDLAGLSPSVRTVAVLNRKLGTMPMTSDNTVAVIEDYEQSLRAMAAAIDTATDYVNVEFYISAWDEMTDPVFRSLVAATERGVAVRYLFDHLGSRGIPGYKDFVKRLEATRIQFHPMLPIKPLQRRFRRPDLRNHRKILVVDGRTAFMGSQNMTEPGYNKPKNHEAGRKWVELMVEVQGPVVAELNATFASDWYFETDEQLGVQPVTGGEAPLPDPVPGVGAQVVPSGPGFSTENNLRMFNTLIYAADERVSITSPYFVPDESLLYAVTTAAQRGIDIELFVSEESDQFMVGHAQASYYRALLEAGVRIYMYPAPLVLHSKHFTVDDNVAVIGSSNMDMRSFALNYEVSMMMTGTAVVERMRAVEDHYRELSRELTLAEWEQRPFRTRYVDNVMRLTSALQ
ncbi:cardiolipin synthase [Marmoricola sp. RAF53]|uniref:cardiolipin synthase n=1 Tax=Marmoricola sp. RAF53 TaxID=3233059 RepID=UPI003F991F43